MKNRGFAPLLVLLVIPLIVLIAGLLYYMAKSYQKENVEEATRFGLKAEAVYVSGSVWKIANGRKIELKEGDLVSETDRIETQADSRAVLFFDEGSVLRLDSNTSISISSLNPTRMEVREDTGNLFVRTSKDISHTFSVSAGDVRVEALGTVFSVEKKKEVKVRVFEDKVKVVEKDSEIQVEKDRQWQEGDKAAVELDKKEIQKSEFLASSLRDEGLEKDYVSPPTKTPTKALLPTTPPLKKGEGVYISLKAKKIAENTAAFWWTAGGISASKGFKLMWSTSPGVSYPTGEGNYLYLSDPSTRQYEFDEFKSGTTYYFKVCEAIPPDNCGIYSNEVSVGF